MKQEYRVLPISSLTISVPVILFIEKLVFIFIPFLRYVQTIKTFIFIISEIHEN